MPYGTRQPSKTSANMGPIALQTPVKDASTLLVSISILSFYGKDNSAE